MDPLTGMVPVEKAREDFALFRKILEKGHPALTEYVTEKRKNLLFDSIYKTIDADISIRDLHSKISFLINEIGCSHTAASLPSEIMDTLYNRKLFFPMPVSVFGNELYVNSDHVMPHGTKILAINNIPVANLFEHLSIYNPVEGRHRETQKYLSCEEFSYNYYLHYGAPAAFEIMVKDTSGVIETIYPEAVTLSEINDRQNSRYYYDPTDVPYYLIIDEENRYALIRIATFKFNSYNQQRAFEEFLKNTFELLHHRDDIQAVVIDLRQNGGGSLYNCFLLNSYLARRPFPEYRAVSAGINKVPYASYLTPEFDQSRLTDINQELKNQFCTQLNGRYCMPDSLIQEWEPNENHFLKESMIITNPDVMSAASYFAVLARQTAGSKIIGMETTGGDYSCNGFAALQYELPNSRIRFQFDYAKLVYSYGNEKAGGRGIIPDYFVPDTYADFKNNSDKQLRYIIDSLISKNK